MKSVVLTVIIVASLFGCASRPSFQTQAASATENIVMSPAVHTKQEFVAHTGSGAFANYLSQEVFFPPVKQVYLDVQKKMGLELKNRGEAHITVVTPPEYDGALKKFVSIDDINRIATSMDLQAAAFKPVCVGMGTAKRNNRDEKTFYIVVESARLVEIRQAIENEFIAKGGRPGDFSATKFFPHITVGFTQADLHESDGVIKDKNSCVLNIEER